MGIFKSLDELDTQEDTLKNEPVCARFSTIENTLSGFLEKIKDGSLTNAKIRANIIAQFNSYINYDNFNNPDTRILFQELWTNERFLNNFYEVIKEDNSLISSKYFDISFINRITYDYYTLSLKYKDKSNQNVLNTLMDITRLIDIKYIVPLTTVMDQTAAFFITMAKFSSMDHKISIQRLNNFIMGLGYEFSEKDIIYIYSRFYSNDFATLFTNTMTDQIVFNEKSLKSIINDRISLALVDILNSMPSVEIAKVLMNYSKYLTLMNVDNYRVSLKNLSADYSRIEEQANILRDQGYTIP